MNLFHNIEIIRTFEGSLTPTIIICEIWVYRLVVAMVDTDCGYVLWIPILYPRKVLVAIYLRSLAYINSSSGFGMKGIAGVNPVVTVRSLE